MSKGKKAFWLGALGVALGGAALLVGEVMRRKAEAEWEEQEMEFSMSSGSMDSEEDDDLWDVDDEGTEIEFVMSAGDPGLEDVPMEEDWNGAWDEQEELELVKVILTGPRTARVRPTEEEEKTMLRLKLEDMIRF